MTIEQARLEAKTIGPAVLDDFEERLAIMAEHFDGPVPGSLVKTALSRAKRRANKTNPDPTWVSQRPTTNPGASGDDLEGVRR